jgi:hypothetical protein
MILGAGTCSTIRCGVTNTATAIYSASLGGANNNVSVASGIIGGGCKNTISTVSVYGASSILGGYQNKTYKDFQTIGGGNFNVVGGTGAGSYGLSVIGGGGSNEIKSYGSTIGGGTGHRICLGSNRGSILGGEGNKIDVNSSCSTIGGGYKNIILGYNAKNTCSVCSTIAGGSANYICRSKDSFIGGGGGNSNLASNGTVIGGGALNCNIATSTLSTIGGGLLNVHNAASFGFIGGGYKNAGSADLTVIGGGSYNVINSLQGVIGGGYVNTINSVDSSILGGVYNTVNAGYANVHIIGSNLTGNISNYTFVNNLCSAGQVNKAGGSFVINHPDPLKTKTTQLIHSFVESPTAGDNIYRFKVTIIDGIGEIILPDYYKFLNENTQVWVSPINGFGIGYGEINEELTKILITANLDMEYNVLVIGTRKDEHAKKYWKGTERLKPKNNDKKTLT